MRETLEELFDSVTPWYLKSRSLNEGEVERLAAIDRRFIHQPQMKKGGSVATGNAKTQIISKVVDLVKQNGPAVAEAVMKDLNNASGGKIKSYTDVVPYATDNRKLSIITKTAALNGVDIRQAFPTELLSSNAEYEALYNSAALLLKNMQSRYQRQEDETLRQGAEGIAKDIARKKRVQAVLNTYGHEDSYFLCHPNGGIPSEDFIWFRAVVLGERIR